MAIGGRRQIEDIASREVAPAEIPDPGNGGAIDVTRSGYCLLETVGGAQTRTLAVPTFIGQRLLLICKTDGGDNVITVASAYDASAHTTITLDDVGDTCELVASMGAAGALKWNLSFTNGPTLG